jgi:hypothetical protein
MLLQVTNKAFQGKRDINFFERELTELFTKILKGGSGIGVIQARVSQCKAKTPQSGIFDCKVVDTADKFGAFWIQTSRYLAFPPTRCRITGISEQEFIKFLDEYKKPKQKELAYEDVKPVNEIATLTAPVAVVATAPIEVTPIEKEPLKLSEMMDQRLCFYMDLLKIRVGNAPSSCVSLADLRRMVIDLGILAKGDDKTFYIKSFPNVMRNWLYSPIATKVDMKVSEIGARGEHQESGYMVNWPTISKAIVSNGTKIPTLRLGGNKTTKVRKENVTPPIQQTQSNSQPSFQLGSVNDFMSQFMAIKSREKAHNEGGIAWLVLRDIHTAQTELRDAEEELARVTQEVTNAKAKLNALKARHDAMPHPLSEDEKAVLAEFRTTLATLAN